MPPYKKPRFPSPSHQNLRACKEMQRKLYVLTSSNGTEANMLRA